MMHKMDYGHDSDTHGPGGIKAAVSRNPNDGGGDIKGNSTPCGPYGHCMGYYEDGGMHGNENAKHRGKTYHFK